jgi:hypothetical protein
MIPLLVSLALLALGPIAMKLWLDWCNGATPLPKAKLDGRGKWTQKTHWSRLNAL